MLDAVRKFVLAPLSLAIGVTGATAPQAAESLKEIRDTFSLHGDPSRISVSGVSAGGWMANQFHIAHSEKIMGAGIVAAGPYHCARNPNLICDYTPYGFFMPHDTCQAVHICTALARKEFGVFRFYMGPPDPETSLASTLTEAQARTIDPLSNLQGDRVWLFSGRKDSLVPQEVMDELHVYYSSLFARSDVGNPLDDIRYVKHELAEHAMIVSLPGAPEENNCGFYGPPFVNDCDYAAAGELLAFIYRFQIDDITAPGPADWSESALLEFDQTPYFDDTDESVSLHQLGHIYVPSRCQGGDRCPVHVTFHGCGQYEEAISERCGEGSDCALRHFFRDAGYNEWAERYDVIILYPQTTSWGYEGDGAKNPKGCWDWWGYTGNDYFRKSGKQIEAVNRMIDCLTGERPCPLVFGAASSLPSRRSAATPSSATSSTAVR